MSWLKQLFGSSLAPLERELKDARKALERRVKQQKAALQAEFTDALADALNGLTPKAQDVLLQDLLKRLPDLLAAAKANAKKVL